MDHPNGPLYNGPYGSFPRGSGNMVPNQGNSQESEGGGGHPPPGPSGYQSFTGPTAYDMDSRSYPTSYSQQQQQQQHQGNRPIRSAYHQQQGHYASTAGAYSYHPQESGGQMPPRGGNMYSSSSSHFPGGANPSMNGTMGQPSHYREGGAQSYHFPPEYAYRGGMPPASISSSSSSGGAYMHQGGAPPPHHYPRPADGTNSPGSAPFRGPSPSTSGANTNGPHAVTMNRPAHPSSSSYQQGGRVPVGRGAPTTTRPPPAMRAPLPTGTNPSTPPRSGPPENAGGAPAATNRPTNPPPPTAGRFLMLPLSSFPLPPPCFRSHCPGQVMCP